MKEKGEPMWEIIGVIATFFFGIMGAYLAWKQLTKGKPHSPMFYRSQGKISVHSVAPHISQVNIMVPQKNQKRQIIHSNDFLNSEKKQVADKKKSENIVKESVNVFEGEILVEPGRHEEIHLELEKGDLIEGIIREQDRDAFNFFIFDEKNYIKYYNNEDFEQSYSEYDSTASEITFKVPKKGVWYLVFDTYRKQNERIIIINLRRRRDAS